MGRCLPFVQPLQRRFEFEKAIHLLAAINLTLQASAGPLGSICASSHGETIGRQVAGDVEKLAGDDVSDPADDGESGDAGDGDGDHARDAGGFEAGDRRGQQKCEHHGERKEDQKIAGEEDEDRDREHEQGETRETSLLRAAAMRPRGTLIRASLSGQEYIKIATVAEYQWTGLGGVFRAVTRGSRGENGDSCLWQCSDSSGSAHPRFCPMNFAVSSDFYHLGGPSVFMAESLRALSNPGSASPSAAGQGRDLF